MACVHAHIYRERETGRGTGGSHKIIDKWANKQKAGCPEQSEKMFKLTVKEMRQRLLASDSETHLPTLNT